MKLNPDLPDGLQDVSDFKISADGSRVVYLADQDFDEVFELYSALADGSGAAVKLNPALPDGDQSVFGGFRISADSTRVVYQADQDFDEVFELYSVPIDGSATAVKLNPALPDGLQDVLNFQISADSTRVVYSADQDIDNVTELYSVPIDGSLAAVKLNPAYTPTDDQDVSDFKISADSTRVVYEADQDIDGVNELYSVPIDGSTAAVKLNPALPDGLQDVVNFQISADGTRVVYRADQDINNVTELYSVPIDGSLAAVKLNPALPDGLQDVIRFQISADGSRVVYLADQDFDGVNELYSVPIDGSLAAVKLNPALPDGLQDVLDFQISADSTRVVYRADQDFDGVNELYSLPIDGSLAAVKLNPAYTETDGQDVFGFKISADGTRVVYSADQDINNVTELYSVPIDGSAAAVKLNPALPDGPQDVGNFQMDSTRVVYRADQDINNVTELYSAPIDGSAMAVKLNPAYTETDGQDVNSFQTKANSMRVFYRADQDFNNVDELYSSSVTETLVESLMDSIESLGLAKNVENPLSAPLKNALKKLQDGNPDNDEAVCGKLDEFIGTVEEKVTAGQLDAGDGAQLITQALAIQNLLDCE